MKCLMQKEILLKQLIADGIKISANREEYVPGDTVIFTIQNNTRLELKYQPTGFNQEMLNFGINGLKARSKETAFSIVPGKTKKAAMIIPETADPGRYQIYANYIYMDWAPGGEDLSVTSPEKFIKITGPLPSPVPRKGRVEQKDKNHVLVYLGEKTSVEAVMGNKPLELEFFLPEGVGYARIKGVSLNSYEKHAEYLWFRMTNGKSVSGGNIPPDIPARVNFEMDLDREAATSYGFVMKYQDWVGDKKPLRFNIFIEMDVIY